MSDDRRALSADAQRAVHHYEERLLEFAAASATYGHADPETALWNGRRVAEAACLIVLCAVRNEMIENIRGKSQGPKGLDELLKELDNEKQLVDPQRTLFENLQRSTNIGVHVRYGGRAIAGDLTDQAHELLRRVVAWLYEKSVARPYLAREDRWKEVDDKLQRSTKGQPSPHQLIERLEELLRDINDQRSGLLARAEAAEKRIETLQKALDNAAARAQPPSPAPPTPKQAPARASSRSNFPYVAAIAGLVGLGIGGCVAGSLWWLFPGTAPRAPAPNPAAASVAPTPAPGPAAATPAPEPAPTPAPPPAEPADDPAPRCPDGMALVPPIRLTLSQPRPARPNWPPASPARVDPFDHPGFCISIAPEPHGTPTANAACRGAEGACVTRAEAAEVCSRQARRLPSLADWEAVARASVPVQLGPEREWIADPFPPAVLNRKGPSNLDAMFRGPRLDEVGLAPDDLRWSWNQALSENRALQAGYRCVADVGG